MDEFCDLCHTLSAALSLERCSGRIITILLPLINLLNFIIYLYSLKNKHCEIFWACFVFIAVTKHDGYYNRSTTLLVIFLHCILQLYLCFINF